MSALKPDIEVAVFNILERRANSDSSTSLLAGVSGIDGSGKGFVARRIAERLLEQHIHAVVIPGDGWLNLPAERFNARNPDQHFYENAFRMDEMFDQLVLPLKRRRSHSGVMAVAQETAETYGTQSYGYENVDVIILECIFLFKSRYRHHFDVAIWIDCTFETALERAIRRAQEGLSVADTIQEYETIYFPAQRIHLCNDRPRELADLVIDNS